jgi:hypothetical protein
MSAIPEPRKKVGAAANSPMTRNGVPLFAPKPGARKPDLRLINRLRDRP